MITIITAWPVFAIRNGTGLKHRNNSFAVHVTQGDSHCSGVRLSKNYILTAAHCIKYKRSVTVKWYENKRSKTQRVRYNNIQIFSKKYSQELAVIPISGGPYNKPELYDYRLLNTSDEIQYKIYGFGISANSAIFGQLRFGKMSFKSHLSYQGKPMLEFIRSHSKGNNPCQGDSGGPVFLESPMQRSLIGIVSFIRSSRYKIQSRQKPSFICSVADKAYYIPLSFYEKELAPYRL